MLRKISLIFMIIGLVATSYAFTSADEYQKVNLLIDRESVSTDQPAVIYNSRTVVPLRVIAEAFDCDVDWISDTKTIVISQSGASLYLTVGSNIMTAAMDGEQASVEMDTAPIIINNRTMVPVSFISDFFDYDTDWDAATKTVNINTGSKNASSGDNDSSADLIQNYIKLLDTYTSYDNAIVEKIDNMTVEQLEEYTSIVDKFNAHLNTINSVDYTEKNVQDINLLVNEIKAFSAKIGVETKDKSSVDSLSVEKTPVEIPTANETQPAAVYYVNVKPYSTDGGFTCFMDKSYNGYSDEIVGMDDSIAEYMINTFNSFSEKLQSNKDKMTDRTLEVFQKQCDMADEMLDGYKESPNDYLYPIAINGINAELGALAEGINVDIGEDLKDYDVAIDNSVYSSQDIVEVRTAHNDALKKKNEYTSQQLDEYTRISSADMYYDFNQEDKESIDYYRGKLILLDRINKRLEIFADKYGIDL